LPVEWQGRRAYAASMALTQSLMHFSPCADAQRLLITGGDSAKPSRAAAPAKENGDAAVPVTANSADANGASDAASSIAQANGEQQVEETPGQLVELKFRAPRAGKYDLTLFCISGGLFSPHTLQSMKAHIHTSPQDTFHPSEKVEWHAHCLGPRSWSRCAVIVLEAGSTQACCCVS